MHPQSVSNRNISEVRKIYLAKKVSSTQYMLNTYFKYIFNSKTIHQIHSSSQIRSHLILPFSSQPTLSYLQIHLALPAKYTLNASTSLHLSAFSRVQANMISFLDGCNSFLTGLPAYILIHLHSIIPLSSQEGPF